MISFNKILASIGFTLAVLAALAGSPQRNASDVISIAHLVETEQDHITPLELADQLYSGKKIRLIDLRDSVSYAAVHLYNAERMSMEQLLHGAIRRNEVAVLYSEGGIHASQAWILLKINHFDSVYTVLGGFTGWKEEVLYPELKEETTDAERSANERRRTLSYFFGGEPRKSSGESPTTKSSPQKQSGRSPVPPMKFRKEEEKLRYHC